MPTPIVQNNAINSVDPDGEDCVFTQNDKAYVARGDCSGLPEGAKYATYVAGTVDEKSGQYDSKTGTISFSYTPYSTDAGGSGAMEQPSVEDSSRVCTRRVA